MKKDITVLFLSSWYPNRTSPTNGNFVQRHAQAVATKCKVCVIHAVSDPSLNDKEVEPVVTTEAGITEIIVYYAKAPRSLPVLTQVSGLQRYQKAHMLGLEKAKTLGFVFDIIHANVAFPVGWIALRMHKALQIPYIITEHWTHYLPQNHHKLNWYIKRLSRLAYKHAACACPVSHNLKAALQSLSYGHRYEVVPNVVDTTIFKSRQHNTTNFRFIHISTLLDEHKNISGLLRSFAALLKHRRDVSLSIIGDGPAEAHIAYAKTLGIDDHINFHGEKTIEEIAVAMQQHDAFVLFSNYENLPCVIIEAHACGLPVIATDVGGISEQINPENGLLIDAAKEDDLCTAMIAIIDNYDKYNAEAIRAEAVAKYSYPEVGKQFFELYKKMIDCVPQKVEDKT